MLLLLLTASTPQGESVTLLPWLPASSHPETALVTSRIHSTNAQMTWQVEWHKKDNNADQKEVPQREMPFYPGSFTSTKSLALAVHDPGRPLWKLPGHCRAGEQTEAPGSSSRNRYFTTNFHGSCVIDCLLTRKVVKCLRAVKCWQGDVWDAGAGGRNWELMSQWVVS